MWFKRRPGKRTPSALTGGSPDSSQRPAAMTAARARLPVDLITTGMKVVKLDRPWTDVPVLFQGFTVENNRHIQVLRHYCHWVVVEGEPRILALAQQRLHDQASRATRPMKETRSLDRELPKARDTFVSTQAVVDRMLGDIERGYDLDLDEARPAIRECIKSINRNVNAMFWMSRIKDQDRYNAEHCLRVALFAIAFGRFLGLHEDDLEVVGLCGLLHDVGKMKVDPAILNKPGRLTHDEMEHIRQHPALGYQLLQSQHTLEPIITDVTLHHHERIDGAGYPDQLADWQISRFARLVSIVDAFDAITSDRCYQAGRSTADAMGILFRGRGEQFDAEMVEAFIRMVGIYPPGTLVQLTSGEVALVVGTHPGKKLKPRVEILLDADKKPTRARLVDLASDPTDARGEPIGIAQPAADGAFGVSLQERIEDIVASGRTRLPDLPGSATP